MTVTHRVARTVQRSKLPYANYGRTPVAEFLPIRFRYDWCRARRKWKRQKWEVLYRTTFDVIAAKGCARTGPYLRRWFEKLLYG